MPTIVTVTAVSTTNNTLTAVAHGLLTGDRFRLHNVGGALPAATPSLAGVTDYFAVRVDADTIKVAVSSADALAGTPVVVDITGTGSGTTKIEYGLPYCIPNVIAGPGTQVKSADMNAVWNALVQLYDLLTGQSESIWPDVTLAGTLSVGGDIKHGDKTLNIPGPAVAPSANVDCLAGQARTTGAGTMMFPVELLVGDRIKSVTFARQGDGSVDVTTLDFIKINPAGTAASIVSGGSQTITNVSASIQDTTLDLTDTVVASGDNLYLVLDVNATGLKVWSIRVVYDRP